MFVRSGLGPLAHKTFLYRKTKFIPFAASELEVKITKTKYNNTTRRLPLACAYDDSMNRHQVEQFINVHFPVPITK
jgi:hypothetical protein